MGAEAEVWRVREGVGWAEEGRRRVGGLVERGSGAVWRYAGCLCGLSRRWLPSSTEADWGSRSHGSPGHGVALPAAGRGWALSGAQQGALTSLRGA